MRNKERYLISAILLLLAGIDSLSAVSFDCAKASNQTEKLICASARISAADDRLAEVYRKARDQALNLPLLIKDQRYWLMDRNVIV